MRVNINSVKRFLFGRTRRLLLRGNSRHKKRRKFHFKTPFDNTFGLCFSRFVRDGQNLNILAFRDSNDNPEGQRVHFCNPLGEARVGALFHGLQGKVNERWKGRESASRPIGPPFPLPSRFQAHHSKLIQFTCLGIVLSECWWKVYNTAIRRS